MAEPQTKFILGFAYKEFLPERPMLKILQSVKPNSVVFLHGMLCSKEIWSKIPQYVANETNRTVYTYDARKHGETKNSEDFKSALNVADLFRFMNALILEEVVLVGHDMGGITAIRAALENPKRVEMVFTIDTYTSKLPDECIDEYTEFMMAWSQALEKVDENTPLEEVTRTIEPILFRHLPESDERSQEQACAEPACMSANFDYNKSDEGYKVRFNEGALKALAELKDSQKEYEGLNNTPAFFSIAPNFNTK